MEKTNNRLDEISDAEKYNVNLYNCPYLNLVNAILKRELDDLTLDLITDTQPWRKKKKNSYLKLARARAYLFFFDKQSSLYKDFLFWCDLCGFNPFAWQKKALLHLAQKVLDSPDYYMNVIEKIAPKYVQRQVRKFISELLKIQTIN